MRSLLFGTLTFVSLAGAALAQTPGPAQQPMTPIQRDMQALSADVGTINNIVGDEVMNASDKLKASKQFVTDFGQWSKDAGEFLAANAKQIKDLQDRLAKAEKPSAAQGPQSHPVPPSVPQSHPVH